MLSIAGNLDEELKKAVASAVPTKARRPPLEKKGPTVYTKGPSGV
jgi:hypothetical protein